MPKQVALFITCLTDQFYPETGVAVCKILEKLDCHVSFPQAQTCCGQPFYNNGFLAETRPLAQRMIEIFEDYEYVVTPSGSCCAMVRQHYPHLFAGDKAWLPSAERLAARTFEFVEFLTGVLKVDLSAYKLPQPTTLTYHYTCHQRGLGMTDEPVTLLKQMGNVKLVPLEKSDQCCGFGGTFAVKYPEISGAITQDKVGAIQATGAEVTVCNDAGCTMNIAGMCHRSGVRNKVTHIAELIASAMKLDGTL